MSAPAPTEEQNFIEFFRRCQTDIKHASLAARRLASEVSAVKILIDGMKHAFEQKGDTSPLRFGEAICVPDRAGFTIRIEPLELQYVVDEKFPFKGLREVLVLHSSNHPVPFKKWLDHMNLVGPFGCSVDARWVPASRISHLVLGDIVVVQNTISVAGFPDETLPTKEMVDIVARVALPGERFASRNALNAMSTWTSRLREESSTAASPLLHIVSRVNTEALLPVCLEAEETLTKACRRE